VGAWPGNAADLDLPHLIVVRKFRSDNVVRSTSLDWTTPAARAADESTAIRALQFLDVIVI